MKQTLRDFWQQRNPRERSVLIAAGLLIASALFYTLIWEPISKERTRLSKSLPQLRKTAAEVEAGAAEFARLKTSPASIQAVSGNLTGAVEQSASAHQIRELITAITSLDSKRVQVVLPSAPFDNWVQWVKALQMELGVRVDSMQISALPEPGLTKIQAVFSTASP